MLKISIFSVLLLLSAPALAINKCEINGKTSYSDTPCDSGKSLPLKTSIQDGLSPQDLDFARQRSAREKKELERYEKERHRVEAQEQKEQQKLAKTDAAHKRKCAALALKQKWSDEDATAATGKAVEKSKRVARRHAEKYEMECGK